MTWLGDENSKVSGNKKDKMLATRAALVEQIKALQAKGPAGKHPHQVKFHKEDITALALKVTKIDKALGRPVDRNV